ncbi:MAG: T9SS type A sorting domain-containing protein [Chitinophagales bacterium]|nr:T9SS type A sorting domain-containing protein [Chitinophagaceae bacterium]MCB9066008.1 T9SS type A sorting domain-containing protein [Chitinophagales bacterium]
MKRIYTLLAVAFVLTLTSAFPSSAQWSVVGSKGIGGSANYTDVVADGSGNVYVAYRDNNQSGKLTVKKYNGSSWSSVGGTGVTPGDVDYVSMAVSGNNIYVAFQDGAKSNEASVYHYNGSSWSYLGNSGFTSDNVYFTSIALDNNGTVYVAYQDKNKSYKATCAKYTGSSWVAVGSTGFTSGIADYVSIDINSQNDVYVAYRDNNAGYKARVMRYNGSGWSTVGSGAFSADMAEYTQIAIDDNDVPYVVYRDKNKGYKATVEKYNGSSWSVVGSSGFSSSDVKYTDIAIDGNGTPFVVYQDGANNDKATVMSFNGSSWSAVSGSGISDGSAYYSTIAISPSDNSMYIAYKDYSAGYAATVMKHAGAAPTVNKWDGSSSKSWNTASNWSANTVPTATSNVEIPSGAPRYPSITSGTSSCKNLTIKSGASVTVDGGTLEISGTITNNGTFDAEAGKIVLKGSSKQTIAAGTFTNKTVWKLELDNSAGGEISDTIFITHTYYPTSGTMTTNDKLVLKADSNHTARVDAGHYQGNYFSGKVTVEQYIPGKRAFRFMGHPFSHSISLQELIDDIDITGQGGASNGFTTVAVNNPSAFWWDISTADNSTAGNNPGWKPFTSTYSASWDRYQMARIFVRGSKGQGLTSTSYTPDPVTIDMTGYLNQGDVLVGLDRGSNSNFVICGNPFASAVNLKYVSRYRLNSTFCVWDPHQGTRGGYTSHYFNYDYNLPMGSSFVATVSSYYSKGFINFAQSNKTDGTPAGILKTTAADDLVELRIDDGTTYWDRLLIRFDTAAMPTEDTFDMVKLVNPDLDFYSFSDDDTMLSADSRPFEDGKVIKLGLAIYDDMHLAIKVPQFQIPAGAKMYLHDKLLNKTEEITGGYEYWFDVKANDNQTYGDNRFYINLVANPNSVAETTKPEQPARMMLIPNPATDRLKVVFDRLNEDAVVTVTNLSGSVLYTEAVQAGSGGVRVSVDGWAAGIYVVTLQNEHTKITAKLIKQ